MHKDKAIIVVSYGTADLQACEASIGAIEEDIRKEFDDFEVFRVFTGKKIREMLYKKSGIKTDSLEQALDKALENGIKKIIIQPTHISEGVEYDAITDTLKYYEDKFEKIICSDTLTKTQDDIKKIADIIRDEVKGYIDDITVVCFAGHGTFKSGRDIYSELKDSLKEEDNIYIATLEPDDSFEEVLNLINDRAEIKKIVLMPLMIVAGNHAANDIDGAKSEAWRPRLEKRGFQVEFINKGLGAIKDIRKMFSEHIKIAKSEL